MLFNCNYAGTTTSLITRYLSTIYILSIISYLICRNNISFHICYAETTFHFIFDMPKQHFIHIWYAKKTQRYILYHFIYDSLNTISNILYIIRFYLLKQHIKYHISIIIWYAKTTFHFIFEMPEQHIKYPVSFHIWYD